MFEARYGDSDEDDGRRWVVGRGRSNLLGGDDEVGRHFEVVCNNGQVTYQR